MTRHTSPVRYKATPNLARTIKVQGRQQQWVAERAGIKAPQLSYVLNGHRTVSEEAAKRIADALGLDIFLLFVSLDGDTTSLERESA